VPVCCTYVVAMLCFEMEIQLNALLVLGRPTEEGGSNKKMCVERRRV